MCKNIGQQFAIIDAIGGKALTLMVDKKSSENAGNKSAADGVDQKNLKPELRSENF